MQVNPAKRKTDSLAGWHVRTFLRVSAKGVAQAPGSIGGKALWLTGSAKSAGRKCLPVFALKQNPLKTLLDRILQHFAEDDVGLLEKLRNSWSELLDSTLAAQVRPVDLKNGVLILEVNNPSWMYVFEMQHKT